MQAAADRANNNDVCLGSDSISHFGVGKNMVAAMRHWATAGGIIMEASCYVLAGALAYQRSSGPNCLVLGLHYPSLHFDRGALTDIIQKVATKRGWPRASMTAIRRDVACCLRSYVAQSKARAKTAKK